MRWRYIAWFLLLAPAIARGEVTEDFCSDRPGLTTGTCVAAQGTFQLEIGIVEWSGGDGASELALLPSVLRYGIDGRTDLHVAVAPYVRVRGDGDRAVGAGDVTIAVKRVLSSTNSSVAFGLMPSVKIPTAAIPIGNGEWEFGLLLPVDASLGGPWSLTMTPELNWNGDGDGRGRHFRYALAATIGLELAARWSASLDALVARARDGGKTVNERAVAASLAFLASPNLQLDVQADIGLSPDTSALALTTGIALRL